MRQRTSIDRISHVERFNSSNGKRHLLRVPDGRNNWHVSCVLSEQDRNKLFVCCAVILHRHRDRKMNLSDKNYMDMMLFMLGKRGECISSHRLSFLPIVQFQITIENNSLRCKLIKKL